LYIIIDMILKIFDLYTILILLNILGSWIDPYNQISIFQWIRKFTDPYLKMFKITRYFFTSTVKSEKTD